MRGQKPLGDAIKIKIGERHVAVPPGEYLAVVKDIEKDKFAGKRDIFRFIFEIVDGPYNGVICRGFVNAHYKVFSSHSKLWEWLRVVNQEDPESGDSIDLEVFFEKILLVEVQEKASRVTKTPFGNVTRIIRVHSDL